MERMKKGESEIRVIGKGLHMRGDDVLEHEVVLNGLWIYLKCLGHFFYFQYK